ncbi:hypothetical protein DIPPA_12234 [Diplonema papillatum]|nr:hypothetical protein DIPPA_12234 [Diplonema papillatum]
MHPPPEEDGGRRAESFVVGCTGGLIARAATIPLDPHRKSPFAKLVPGNLSDTTHSLRLLYRYTPMWGIRMAVYANSVRHFGGQLPEASPMAMFPYFFASGACSPSS